LFKINGFTPQFNQPPKQQNEAANKPAIENNITGCNTSMKKSMVVHNSCCRVNGQPKQAYR
jgi:hypothetical protein